MGPGYVGAQFFVLVASLNYIRLINVFNVFILILKFSINKKKKSNLSTALSILILVDYVCPTHRRSMSILDWASFKVNLLILWTVFCR